VRISIKPILWAVMLVPTASASVIPIMRAAFPLASTSISFSAIPVGTDLNDIAMLGASFSYVSDGAPNRGVVEIQSGPGATNNITSPSAVSSGNNTGTVFVDFDGPATFFGFGYSLLTFSPVESATTVTLFSGFTLIGFLDYAANPDPQFAGGFAGVQSTDAFDHVEVAFNSGAAPAFAFNQVIFANTASQVPEPGTTLFLFTGILFCCLYAKSTASSRSDDSGTSTVGAAQLATHGSPVPGHIAAQGSGDSQEAA